MNCGLARFLIVALYTADNNLQGSLPKELCCLPTLKELVLNNNGLEGTEPECIYRMGLETLDLMGNEFDTGRTGVQQSREVP